MQASPSVKLNLFEREDMCSARRSVSLSSGRPLVIQPLVTILLTDRPRSRSPSKITLFLTRTELHLSTKQARHFLSQVARPYQMSEDLCSANRRNE